MRTTLILFISLFCVVCGSRKVDKQKLKEETKTELSESKDSLNVTKLLEKKEVESKKVSISKNELKKSNIKYTGKSGDEMKVSFNEKTKELVFIGSGEFELSKQKSSGQTLDKSQTVDSKSSSLDKKTEKEGPSLFSWIGGIALLVGAIYFAYRVYKRLSDN